MPKIQNVSPLGDLEVPILRRVVKAGEVVEVPASIAGVPPTPWAPVPDEDIEDGRYIGDVPDYLRREVVQDDGSVVIEACHPGEGLLAQADNFVIAPDGEPAEKTSASTAAEKKTTRKTAASKTSSDTAADSAPAQGAATDETPEV